MDSFSDGCRSGMVIASVCKRLKRRELGYLLVLAALITAGSLMVLGTPSWQEYRSMGDDLVLALGEYRAVNGQYPDRLDQLVPGYLLGQPRVPLAHWYYRLSRSGNSYVLEVKQGDKSASYKSANGRWFEVEKSF